jgi:hypothetical protein
MTRIFGAISMLAVLAILLSACSDVDEKVVVRGDGTSKVHIRSSTSSALLTLAAKQYRFCEQPIKVPATIRSTVQRSKIKENVVCDMEVEGPTDDVFSAMEKITVPNVNRHPSAGQLALNFFHEKRRYRVTLVILPVAAHRPTAAEQFFTMLASTGRVLRWSISAPTISKTNGTLSSDRKTASFTLPLWRVMTNPTELIMFETNFFKTWQ